MPSDNILLNTIDTRPSEKLDKQKTKEESTALREVLSDLQQRLYAQSKYAVLVVIQGMDASGKDGAVKNVFSGINPAGCNVTSFKVPTEEEAKHDFLWRIHKACPPCGMIHVFNRSHYEDILVSTVHKTLEESVIDKKYRMINNFETLLTENNTILLKFYLHVSEKEQLERIDERKTDEFKKWKYQESDVAEVRHRDEYMKVYERIFRNCSEAAPWHIVPSDKNWYKEYCILSTIVKTLNQYDIHYPEFK
jgi:PPK2 family polyphosphate:nucleotide phosphotransferase